MLHGGLKSEMKNRQDILHILGKYQPIAFHIVNQSHLILFMLTYANLSRCKDGTGRVKECGHEEVCMTEVDGNFIFYEVNTFDYPWQLIKSNNSHLAVLQVVP